ncbi:MAG: hypothetical protein LBR11_08080 [Deltaproteobacteria bacterium]|jgi:hypothetical protein|nr:hypothetical protein [Deltaproteobacteria bacterium]
MKSQKEKKIKPWIKKSPYQRRDEVVRLNSRIARSLGTDRQFLYHGYLPEDPRLAEDERGYYSGQIWIDIYFSSRRRQDILYNCAICNFESELVSLAATQALAEIPYDGPEIFGDQDLTPVKDARDQVICYHYRELEEFSLYCEKVQARQLELIQTGLELRERVELDYSYGYGVGLHMCLDIPQFDLQGVKKALEIFFEREESEWTGPPTIVRKDELNLRALINPL